MNSAEIEEIKPGHLFTVWSAMKQGICAGTMTGDCGRLTRVHDGAILLLTNLPGNHPFNEEKWRIVYAVSSDAPAMDCYEFLHEDKLIYLEKDQLTELEQEY